MAAAQVGTVKDIQAEYTRRDSMILAILSNSTEKSDELANVGGVPRDRIVASLKNNIDVF